MDVLHIYASSSWHDEAYIVGNSAALLKMRDAIDLALSENKSQFLSFVKHGQDVIHLYLILNGNEKQKKIVNGFQIKIKWLKNLNFLFLRIFKGLRNEIGNYF